MILSRAVPTAALALALFAQTPASAQDWALRGTVGAPEAPGGLYIGARGGVTQMRDTSYRDTGRPYSFGPYNVVMLGGLHTAFDSGTENLSVTSSYKAGLSGSLLFGYDFGSFEQGLRARMEGEFGLFSAAVDSHEVDYARSWTTVYTPLGGATPIPPTQELSSARARYTGGEAGGSVIVSYALANYYIDFDFGLGAIQPFIGGGIGFAHVDFRGHAGAGNSFMNNDAYGWVYQVGAGVAAAITPNLTLELGYRYMGVDGFRLTAAGGTINQQSLTAHQANLGARYRF